MPTQSFGKFERVLRMGEGRRLKRLQEQAAYIGSLEPDFEQLSDDELRGKTAEFKQRYENGEPLEDLAVIDPVGVHRADISDDHVSGMLDHRCLEVREHRAQRVGPERVEEEHDKRLRRKSEADHIALDDGAAARGNPLASRVRGQIFLRHRYETTVQLHTDDAAEPLIQREE